MVAPHIIKSVLQGATLKAYSTGYISFHFFIFISFKEGGPSANVGLQGALHLLYNITIKNKTNIYYH